MKKVKIYQTEHRPWPEKQQNVPLLPLCPNGHIPCPLRSCKYCKQLTKKAKQ